MINFDEKAVAAGMEKGMYPFTDEKCLSRRKVQLRLPICHVAATSIATYLNRNKISNQLISSRPALKFNPKLEHVFVLADDDDSLTVIDPTYSQFLDYTGFDIAYEAIGKKVYPEKKIEVFELSKRREVADHLAECAIGFRLIEGELIEHIGYNPNYHPVCDMSFRELSDEYSEIWNPDNFERFTPSVSELKQAEQISRYIPDSALSPVKSILAK